MSWRAHAVPLAMALATILVPACRREKRLFEHVSLHGDEAQIVGPFHDNAWGTAEGKRLFVWFNCAGCHSNGGGGMGPPLMDANWRYGAEPRDVFISIMDGRPNGMPRYRDKIPEQQAWQLVEYVQSMSGRVRLDVLPGRSDSMQAREPEVMREPEGPSPEPPPRQP